MKRGNLVQQPPNNPNYGSWQQPQQPNTQYPPQQPWQQPQYPPNTYYRPQQSMIPPPPPPRPPMPPVKKPNPWLIISIIVGGLLIIGTLSTINKSTGTQTDATPTVI